MSKSTITLGTINAIYSKAFTVRKDASSPEYKGTVIIDCSDVTAEELLAYALKQKIVNMQAALRRLDESELRAVLKTPIRRAFSMMGTAFESINSARTSLDKSMASLSKADALRLLKEAQAKLAEMPDDDEVIGDDVDPDA